MSEDLIYKYALSVIPGSQEVELPKGAKILDIQMQHNDLFLWALVNVNNESTKHIFHVVGTGAPINFSLYNAEYLKTVQQFNGGLIWHIFREIK